MYGCLAIEIKKRCPKCGVIMELRNPILYKSYKCLKCGVVLKLVWDEDKDKSKLVVVDE